MPSKFSIVGSIQSGRYSLTIAGEKRGGEKGESGPQRPHRRLDREITTFEKIPWGGFSRAGKRGEFQYTCGHQEHSLFLRLGRRAVEETTTSRVNFQRRKEGKSGRKGQGLGRPLHAWDAPTLLFWEGNGRESERGGGSGKGVGRKNVDRPRDGQFALPPRRAS